MTDLIPLRAAAPILGGGPLPGPPAQADFGTVSAGDRDPGLSRGPAWANGVAAPRDGLRREAVAPHDGGVRGASAGSPLDVALLAHVRHPVSQPFMGGMETHSFHLAAGLVARRHRVRMLAAGDSVCPGELVPIVPRHYEVDFPWHTLHGTDSLNAHLDAIYDGAVVALSRDRPDVVHNNALHRFPFAWAATVR